MSSKEPDWEKNVKDKDDQSVFLHGRIYKRHLPKEGEKYDGLFLTESDCQKIVKEFYALKNDESKEQIHANIGHDKGVSSIVASVNDIYYSKKNGSLNAIFETFNLQLGFNELMKKLEKNCTNVGLSVELDFVYGYIAPSDTNSGKVTILNPNTKNGKEILQNIDMKSIQVVEKKLTGIAIVDLPDHAEDGTFITSWCKNDPKLLVSKDEKLREYIESLPNGDKLRETYYGSNNKEEIRGESKNYSEKEASKTFSSEKNEENNKGQQNSEILDKIDEKTKPVTSVNSFGTVSEEKKMTDALPQTTPTNSVFSQSEAEDATKKSASNDKESKDTSKNTDTGNVLLSKTELEAYIAKEVEKRLTSNGQKFNSANGTQKEKKNVSFSDEDKSSNTKKRANSRTLTKENFEDEQEETSTESKGNESSENMDASNDTEESDSPKEDMDGKSQVTKTAKSNAKNTNSTQARKNEPSAKKYKANSIALNSFAEEAAKLAQLNGFSSTPEGMKAYFKQQYDSGIKKLSALKDIVDKHYAELYGSEDEVPVSTKEEIEESFKNGNYKENSLIMAAVAGIANRQNTQMHRSAERAYQFAKGGRESLRDRQNSMGLENNNNRGQSVSLFDKYFQQIQMSDRGGFSGNGYSERKDNENDMDVDEELSNNNEERNETQHQSKTHGKNRENDGIGNNPRVGKKHQTKISQEEIEDKASKKQLDDYIKAKKAEFPYSHVVRKLDHFLDSDATKKFPVFANNLQSLFGNNTLGKLLQCSTNDLPTVCDRGNVCYPFVQSTIDCYLGGGSQFESIQPLVTVDL